MKNDVIDYISYFIQIIYAICCSASWFGFVHTDMHPKNVFISNSNEPFTLIIDNKKLTISSKMIKIFDFGNFQINKGLNNYTFDESIVNSIKHREDSLDNMIEFLKNSNFIKILRCIPLYVVIEKYIVLTKDEIKLDKKKILKIDIEILIKF